MRRRVDQMLAVGIVEAAGRAAFVTADEVDVGAVDRHRVDLIAAMGPARALETQALPVEREIRFRVLSAVGELAEILQMALLREGHRRALGRGGRGCGGLLRGESE